MTIETQTSINGKREIACPHCGWRCGNMSEEKCLEELGLHFANHHPDRTPCERTSFDMELRQLINRYSKEAASNTPDFILAEYLSGCLDVYAKTVSRRDQWYKMPNE